MQIRIALVAMLVALGVSSQSHAQTLEQIQDLVTGALVNASANGTQAAAALAIGAVCPQGQNNFGTITIDQDLNDRCDEAVGAALSGNASSVAAAGDMLQGVANEEDSLIASLNVDASSGHMQQIANHMSGLHGGGLVYQPNGFDWAGGAAGDEGMGSRWGFFVNGLYASSDRDTTSLESGFEADDFGVTAGIDYAMSDKLVIGAAFGYKNSDADIDMRGGNLDTDSYSFFGFFSYFPSEFWYFDAMIGYTDNEHEQERNIIYSIASGTVAGGVANVNNTALSDTDSDEFSFSGTIGYNIPTSGFNVSPFLRLDYADTEIDGFSERMRSSGLGSGLALNVADQEFTSVTLALGGEFSTEWQMGGTTLYPMFTAEYVHEFDNDNEAVVASFIGDPTNTRFSLPTDSPDENFFNIGFGVSAIISDSVVGFARYQGLFGYDDLDVHAAEFGFRVGF